MNKCTIVAIDAPGVQISAQYNPKEISIDKSVPWTKHKPPQGDAQVLEFTSAENRTLSMELFFDTYEKGSSVYGFIALLEAMTVVPPGKKGKEAHPPRVMVAWGAGGLPPFKGVIEKLSTKYTMFMPNGTPVRATCSISIKEVDEVQGGGGSGGGAGAGGAGAGSGGVT